MKHPTADQIAAMERAAALCIQKTGAPRAEWRVEYTAEYGLLLIAPYGRVTVDTTMRNFTLGACPVYKKGPFKGRQWLADLIEAAAATLETCA